MQTVADPSLEFRFDQSAHLVAGVVLHDDHRFPAEMLESMPDWRWTHLSHDVLPALRKAGVSEAQIDQMLVDNPRRILTPCEPY